MANKMIYSFDVYDTCICRTYSAPQHLFFDILPDAPHISKSDRQLFSTIRKSSEKLANVKLGKGKCASIYEIYNNIDQRYFCGYTKETLIKREKDLELDTIRPIPSSLKMVKDLRRTGNRIIFISDMYLDSGFIKLALTKTGFYKAGDGIYVSSDSSLTKRSGELYNYVLQKESIRASQLTHHGDNLISDIESAKKLGIKTIHIDTSIPLPLDRIVNEDASIEELRINAIAKIVRLKLQNQFSPGEISFFAKTIPAIVAYCHWVLAEAGKKNIKTLYFLTRDAQIMHIICSLLLKKDDNINLVLLFGSRKAWTLPSLDFSTSNWIETIATAYGDTTIEDAIDMLQLNETTYKDTIVKFLKNNANPPKTTFDLLKQLINTNSEIVETIKIKAAEQKQLMKDYLASIGIFEDKNSAIVDSGWTLRNQQKLFNIIKSFKEPAEIEGLYFSLAPDALNINVSGSATCFSTNRRFFYKKAIVLEHAILGSTLYPTLSYSLHQRKSKPAFDQSISETRHIFKKNIKYAISFTRELKKLDLDSDQLNAFFKYTLLNLEKILKSPNASEIKHISELTISHGPNQTSTNLKLLFRPIRTLELFKIILNFFMGKGGKTYFWPEASAEISKPIPKLLFKAILKIHQLKEQFKPQLSNHNR